MTDRDRDHTIPMPIPSWMLIDAFRYACGRTSYQVDTTARWIVANWQHFPPGAQEIIQRDLEEEFDRDDRSRREGWEFRPLGHDCDRQSWEAVRALWRTP